MKLSEMKQWLEAHEVQLTKSLGQNFLHDQNQLRRIVAAGEVGAQDKVLEIGPGLGPLTEMLLETGAEVMAIEMDGRFVTFLRERLAGCSRLNLIHDDALDYVRQHREWEQWKMIANLPYSVASPILVELAQAEASPERMVATLQLEVAQRMVAAAGSEHYGALTLLVGLRYESRGWFRIAGSCFFPAPDVDSACVTLVRRAERLLSRPLEAAFVRIVKRGFSQRRKMMFKLLKGDWAEARLASAFATVGLSPQIRAERVSLEQFVQLTRLLV